jgi:hypothetical protein
MVEERARPDAPIFRGAGQRVALTVTRVGGKSGSGGRERFLTRSH